MERFTYVRAESVAHALALLNEPSVRSRVLAGGTDLLLLLRADPTLCDLVVDISLIPELHRIEQDGERVTIGAAATFSEIVENPIVQEAAPVLVQACRQVGAVQIRNMGTLGGNVANAAACADSLPALVCLDAIATIAVPDPKGFPRPRPASLEPKAPYGLPEAQAAGRTGQKSFGSVNWPVFELVLGPNRTRIPASGLLISFSFTVPAAGSRSVFLKLGRRNAMAISRLTVAALGRLDAAGRIAEARLVPGSATPQIRRLSAVEASLLGQTPGEELFRAAAQQAAAEMIRLAGRRWSTEYKESALMAMVARALQYVMRDA
jgi:CO/xanthine dehydrogenase FAD-binding subunit